MQIKPFEKRYRDDLIFMVLEAKDALGRVPRINEDLLDIDSNYFDKGDSFWIAVDENDRVSVRNAHDLAEIGDRLFEDLVKEFVAVGVLHDAASAALVIAEFLLRFFHDCLRDHRRTGVEIENFHRSLLLLKVEVVDVVSKKGII